jgi:adenine-specific DNA-methyltransferase
MDKLKMHTPDLSQENIAKLQELFPGCVTEAMGDDERVQLAVDFDQLRQELSGAIVEGPQERFHLNWPGKRSAAWAGNAPVTKAILPDITRSIDFNKTRNVFIQGDNLEALKMPQEAYLEQIKMIYIDPPYNTGRDFIYDDDYAESTDYYLARSNQVDENKRQLVINSDSNGRYHSDWLSMMLPRLRLARNLLRQDGVIFISIDDNEAHSLKRLCDEVFGEKNFVATVIWQKVYAPKNSARWLSEDHDYILIYAKSADSWVPNKLPRTPEMEARYQNRDNDPRGPWKSSDLSARNRYDAGIYPITCPSGRVIDGPPRGTYWRINQEKFKSLDADGRIWWGTDGDNTPSIKRFLSEVSSGRTPQTLWPYKEVGHTQDAKKELLKYVDFKHTENVLNSVKPTGLIQRMLQLATKPSADDIILDFFCGSGSTAHAVLKQNAEDGGNRRFITVQIDEPLPKPEKGLGSILDMALRRIHGVTSDSEFANKLQDAGFRIFKIDSSNLTEVNYTPDQTTQQQTTLFTSHIKPDRTPEDLLFQVLLDWGVDITLPIATESVAGKQVFLVDTNALAACFDLEITEALITELAKHQPLRAVFRDDGFKDDATKINCEQIFKQLSPATDVKAI